MRIHPLMPCGPNLAWPHQKQVASAWLPTALSGLSFWVRSDLGVTDAGAGAVSAWADQSGAGHHLTQPTAGNRPTLVSSVINGQPVIRFGPTASNKWLDFAVDWAQANAITVYAVVKYVTNGADFQILLRGGGPHIYLGDGPVGYNKPITYGSGTAIAAWGTALTNGNNYMIRWTSNATTETVGVRVGGGAEVQVVGTGVVAVNWQELGLSLNIQDTMSDIAEVMIFDRALTGPEDTLVTSYLNTRYGL